MDYLIELNGKKQVVLCVLLSVMIGTCMFMMSASTVQSEDVNGYYVTLDISQYRDDVLIDRRVITDDYILRNFAHMWLEILSGDRYLDALGDYKTTDISNVLRQGTATKFYIEDSKTTIRIGTDSTPVTVNDYKLETQVLSAIVDDGATWYNGDQFNVTADATIVSDGSYTITEAGLSISKTDGGDADRHTLVCRDVFSGIAIVNGDVLVIRYIFQFNVGV